MNKLYIIFFWHFHQPYYKDLFQDIYILPYTKIHLLKNYYMMGKVVLDNKVNVNFNFTPILLDQINDYESGSYNCLLTNISKMDINDLEKNKVLVIETIKKFLNKSALKKYNRLDELINRDINYLNIQDLLDLITLYNLSLIPEFEKDEDIKKIENKEKNFDNLDRFVILNKQDEIIKKVIPLYNNLLEENLVDITISPYSHPIMPLIIDTEIARSCGETFLPKERFSYPEDIYDQINLGKEIFYKNFKKYPKGIWPPEGSVSYEVVEILFNTNFTYFATDEEILFKTLKKSDRSLIYKPYYFEKNGKKIYVFFRDRTLSDLISFKYSSMDENDAINDLLKKIREIKDSLKEDGVLLILLDGENPWEYYKNNGLTFLNLLYKTLKNEEGVVLSKINNVIESLNSIKLTSLEAGSWINGNFKTWIGEEEDNLSWDYLKIIRDDFESLDINLKQKLKKLIFILEGSDWNWWYGKSYNYDIKKDFDELYRKHMLSFYILSNRKIRNFVYLPIISDNKEEIKVMPKSLIEPKLDGKETDFFEWVNGFTYNEEENLTEIFLNTKMIELIKLGYDDINLYFLIKINKEIKKFDLNFIFKTKKEDINIKFSKNDNFTLEKSSYIDNIEYIYKDYLEIKMPILEDFYYIDKKLLFFIVTLIDGKPITKVPKGGYFSLDLNEKNILSNWVV